MTHGVHQVPLSKDFPGWVATSYSRGSSWLRDRTHISRVSCIGRWILYHCATREACKFLLSIKLYLLSKIFPESLGRINHTKKFPQYFVPSSCQLHWWYHPAILSYDSLFSFCPQSFPMSQLFSSDDQNTGVSASASDFSTSIQGWFPLRFTGLISLLSKAKRVRRKF